MWNPVTIAGLITAATGLITAVTVLVRQVRHEAAPHPPDPPPGTAGP